MGEQTKNGSSDISVGRGGDVPRSGARLSALSAGGDSGDLPAPRSGGGYMCSVAGRRSSPTSCRRLARVAPAGPLLPSLSPKGVADRPTGLRRPWLRPCSTRPLTPPTYGPRKGRPHPNKRPTQFPDEPRKKRAPPWEAPKDAPQGVAHATKVPHCEKGQSPLRYTGGITQGVGYQVKEQT